MTRFVMMRASRHRDDVRRMARDEEYEYAEADPQEQIGLDLAASRLYMAYPCPLEG
jgi:hypothetical protein